MFAPVRRVGNIIGSKREILVMIYRCYGQTDLVALYDLINSGVPDWDYYFVLVSKTAEGAMAPGRVVDAGYGTGALEVEVARLGVDVTGLDPAGRCLRWSAPVLGGHSCIGRMARGKAFKVISALI